MSKILIKICGITDPELAMETAHAGADFIGLVFDPNSKRLVTTAKAKSISKVLSNTKTKPVAVFTEHSASEMQRICEACDIQIVQLHGNTARSEHHLLEKQIKRVYVQSTEMEKFSDDEVKKGDPKRDYLLFDHTEPGSGICFDWNQFHYQGHFKWFLAGGLNYKNIAQSIKKLKPTGVDVSSGVENRPGIKNIKLIQQFICEIHRNET